MSSYQSFLKDCDCIGNGIIFKDNNPVCRWCRKPYGKGGCFHYRDNHFPDGQTTKEGWSDEDVEGLLIAAACNLKDFVMMPAKKFAADFKASKQSKPKEERCIIESKDLRVFTDKKEEVKKSAPPPSNTERVRPPKTIRVGIKEDGNLYKLNGEKLYTQADMEESFMAGRKMAGLYKLNIQTLYYPNFSDFLTTKNNTTK